MQWLGEKLLKTNNITKDVYLFNTIASVLNSFQTALILIAITRMGTDQDSSYFVMAFAIGNLLYNIGRFGVRQFQVTDVNETYSFIEYVMARNITSVLMVIAIGIYVIISVRFNSYTTEKALSVILVCLYKGIESYEDVLHGRMQQLGRLDVASKILMIRFIMYIGSVMVVFLLTKMLLLALLIGLIVSIILAVSLNFSVVTNFIDNRRKIEVRQSRVRELLKECLPLFLTMVLLFYLGNSPKYVLDGIVTDDLQTGFNVVFMPAFIVSLLSNFIFNPNIKGLGELWNEQKYNMFGKKVLILSLVPIGVTLFGCMVAIPIGIPVLELVYKIDLVDYSASLIWITISSGIIAVMNLFIIVITIMRRQRELFIAYIIGAISSLIFERVMLKRLGLVGLCEGFFISLIICTTVMIIVIVANMLRIAKRERKS